MRLGGPDYMPQTAQADHWLSTERRGSAQPPVIVGLGTRSIAGTVVEMALTEAGRRGCDLVVAHIAHPVDAWPALAWASESLVPQTQIDALAVGEATLQRTLSLIEASVPAVNVESRLYEGPIVPTLLDLSREAQLLVLADEGTRSNRWASPVVRSTVRRAGCPVAVVPADPLKAHHPRTPVVVGIRQLSRAAPALATALSSAEHAAVDVVAVCRSVGWIDDVVAEALDGRYSSVRVRPRHVLSRREYHAALLAEYRRARLLVLSGSRRFGPGSIMSDVAGARALLT